MLIHEAGLRPQPSRRVFLRVLEPVEVSHGQKLARLSPSDQFEVSYSISFDHPLLRHQAAAFTITQSTFEDELAPARTFGFLRDVEAMRKAGLALGGSLENAVVIGETGVLNNRLRFDDEFVRHKILDAIGDLSLLGHPLMARFEAQRAGHALHTALAHKLLANPRAFDLTLPGIPRPPKASDARLAPAPVRA
jgi:UDP-3-O-[3-hydroxymyristoyl] N-acetylglucosamine deacetylase